MLIRNITKDDYEDYIKLIKQLSVFTGNKTSKNQFEEFINTLNEHHQVIVIEDEIKKKIVAAGTILIEKKIIHNFGKVAHIEDVVTDKEYRGLGLGKQIITKLKDIAITNSCYKIILNCKRENVKFYKKNNFKENDIQMVIYN
jgi:glucosamine-phosphate N-acetyltransferase